MNSFEIEGLELKRKAPSRPSDWVQGTYFICIFIPNLEVLPLPLSFGVVLSYLRLFCIKGCLGLLESRVSRGFSEYKRLDFWCLRKSGV